MRNTKALYIVFTVFVLKLSFAQNKMYLDAKLDAKTKVITIEQKITYINSSQDNLSDIYLNDWANSFSGKTTPLGERFSEDFLKRFYYAKQHERGSTIIQELTDKDSNHLSWSRPDENPDIIKIELPAPLLPGESYAIKLKYQIKLPSDKFTRYGYHENGNFSLRYWYIVPAVYNDGWKTYSNKNLDDFYAALADYEIELSFPNTFELYSDLEQIEINGNNQDTTSHIRLTAENRNEVNLYLETNGSFYQYQSNGVQLVSNIEDNDLNPKMKKVATTRIVKFLEKRLGPYPFEKIIISENDYKNSPVYGLNQLPDILRPFPDGFQYEIKQLKTITKNYLEKTLLVNPRYDAWIKDAIHIYLMMAYTEQYYPEMKIIGNLSNIIGVRWFHFADLEFNDQYFLAYKNMARLFLDQPLNTPRDKLVKFNANIANTYKAGIGFKYLEDYLEDDNIVAQSISSFYKKYALKPVSSAAYQKELTAISPKDVDWFFEDFVPTQERLDFKIQSVKKGKDSLQVTIKNKQNNVMPVSLYGLRDGQVVSKTWVNNIVGNKTVTIANDDLDKLALDYNQNIPEINRRNNYRNLKWIFNKPFQFRLFQDVEDPRYNQIFFIPEFEFNIYDGFSIGTKLYNKTVLRRPLDYKITPFYGLKSKRILGSANIFYRQQIANHGLYQIRYGISGSTFSYAPDLLFRRISPNLSFSFRPEDLRSNEKQNLAIRVVSVQRDKSDEVPLPTPNYNVFNVRYRYSDFNLIDVKSYIVDYQIAKNFSKVSTTFNYRKTFLNNRQVNLRLFAGAFLYNDTEKDGDFFSFALDRPTDYLFDYNYLGRSEDTGLTSQQIIIAEGGFKSQLKYPFANEWITTFNANTNIWNWIYAYGDVGLVKNRNNAPKFVYDSGIRLSLVADYFELFFPIYSNKGWEVAQPGYDQQIRFIITLSPQTLIGLFTREWY